MHRPACRCTVPPFPPVLVHLPRGPITHLIAPAPAGGAESVILALASAAPDGTRASETSFGCHDAQPAAGSLTVAHSESVCPLALSCARVTVTRAPVDFASGRYAMSQFRL